MLISAENKKNSSEEEKKNPMELEEIQKKPKILSFKMDV